MLVDLEIRYSLASIHWQSDNLTIINNWYLSWVLCETTFETVFVQFPILLTIKIDIVWTPQLEKYEEATHSLPLNKQKNNVFQCNKNLYWDFAKGNFLYYQIPTSEVIKALRTCIHRNEPLGVPALIISSFLSLSWFQEPRWLSIIF